MSDDSPLIEMSDKDLGISDAVIFMGNVDNVFDYMSKSLCVISTSLWEDPGFVMIETAICRKIIISSDCPNGPREIICNDDFLFTNGSVNELLNKFELYKNKSKLELLNQRIQTKKKVKLYTLFQHYKELNLILN